MRAPDYTGKSNWCAWKSQVPVKNPWFAVSYLLYCPGAHAFWQYWMLAATSLEELPGVPSPAKHRPGVTHEILSIAISPEATPDPDRHPWKLLSPPDLIAQVELTIDTQAETLIVEMINNIMSGHISPDSDFRSTWLGFLDRRARELRENQPGSPLVGKDS